MVQATPADTATGARSEVRQHGLRRHATSRRRTCPVAVESVDEPPPRAASAAQASSQRLPGQRLS